jgi:putative membrane protein
VTAATGEVAERRRLHPLTPLLRGAKMLAVAIAYLSWQGYARLGLQRWLVLAVGILVGAVALSAVSWLVTGYQVVGRELRVYEGLLRRRTRAIPLDRIHGVDLVRPFFARLAGMAELRLEVIGGHKTEAPLAYLSVGEATRLRDRLLALAARREVADAGGAGTAAGPEPLAETPVHAVANRDVLIANVLTPLVLFLPFVLAVTGWNIWYNQTRTDPLGDAPAHWSLIGIGSAATALIGVAWPPVRRLLADWNFRISLDPDGLRLRHGMLDTRSQTVPPHRVQAVEIVTPWLWRWLGWVRVRLDVAGYAGALGGADVHGGVLLPVADRNTARTVIARVLGGVDVDAVPLRPVPRRGRLVSPLAWRKRAFGYTGEVVAARDGWLTERLVVTRLARVQSVRVVQGPVQRALRLADLHVDTAAGKLHTVGRDRDAAEAYALAGTLAELSRAARAAERAPHQRSNSAAAPNAKPTYSQPTTTSIT